MRLLTCLNLTIYSVVSLLGPSPRLLADQPVSVKPTELSQTTNYLNIPSQLGKVEYFLPKEEHANTSSMTSPVIIHIQSAHGIYEAEKNIQAILESLSKEKKMDVLFLEGGSGRIDPELFDLFPERPDLNLRAADQLVQRAEMSGPELFLIDRIERGEKRDSEKTIEAYGIEDIWAYRRNRKVFQQVFRGKSKSEFFLRQMRLQIEKLGSVYLNPLLKDFLDSFERYETKNIEMIPFLQILKRGAEKHLDINFDDPFHQTQWPYLTRLFRVTTVEEKLDLKLIEREKRNFLKDLRIFQLDPLLIERTDQLLSSSFIQNNYSDQRLSMRRHFEKLFNVLPNNFSFASYDHLRLYIQCLIFKSEIKDKMLFQEVNRLQDLLLNKLSHTETERRLTAVFQDCFSLKKLFALELTRHDYEDMLLTKYFAISGQGSLPPLKPSVLASRLLGLDKEKRVDGNRHLATDLQAMDHLYALALRFYGGAHERESFMGENVTRKLKTLDKKIAVVVTGGFHADGLKKYFASQGYGYIRVTPQITGIPQNNPYLTAMLEDNTAIFASSQIANRLMLQPLARIMQEGANPYYLRDQVAQLVQAILEEEKPLRLNRDLFARQYAMEPIASDIIQAGQKQPVFIFHDILKPVRMNRVTRSEMRNRVRISDYTQDLILNRLQEIQLLVRQDASYPALDSQLNFVLDSLAESLKVNHEEIQNEALLTLAELLSADPALLSAEAYKARQTEIKKALINHLKFIKSFLAETPAKTYDELIALGLKIYPREKEQLREMPFSTAKQPELIDWLFKNRTGSGGENLQVMIPYDTGRLPSQIERGRYIALYLYLENRTLHPTFRSVLPIRTPVNDQGFFGGYFGHSAAGMNYFFRMTSGPDETNPEQASANLPKVIPKRMREIQLLNLGLLFASAEDSFRIFFPNETPFWMKDNEAIQQIAQAYRTFERRLVSYLRDYNPYRFENKVEDINDSRQFHEERKDALRRHLLEEILYPSHSWLIAEGEQIDPLNQLLPFFRALEGMQLQPGKGRVDIEGKRYALGEEFIRRVEFIGDEYLTAINLILAGRPIDSSQFSWEYLNAFNDAQKISDPFIDDVFNEGYTKFYKKRMRDAIDQGQISKTQLPDPSGVYQRSRSELRGSIDSFIPREVLKVTDEITEQFIDPESPYFDVLYEIFFNDDLRSVEKHIFDSFLTEQYLKHHGDVIGGFSQGWLKKLLAGDDSFGILTIPVPQEIDSSDLLEVLTEMTPLLKKYPKKILLFISPGTFSRKMTDEIYDGLNQRVILLEGALTEILDSLFNPENRSKLPLTKRETINRVLTQASKLAGGRLSPQKILESSVVAAGDEYFKSYYASQIGKQFIQDSALSSLPPLEQMEAYLFYGLTAQAELLKQPPDEIRVERKEENVLRLFFRTGFADKVQNLITATRKILAAA